MVGMLAECPDWLAHRFKKLGGSLPFSEYMNLALNDSLNGFYSSGRASIGKNGDFVTSPSLTSDFAELLSIQVKEWFDQLKVSKSKLERLALIDVGPGEGDLSLALIKTLKENAPSLIPHIEFVLVEINQGMKLRQKEKLSSQKDVLVSWKTFEEISINPPIGIVIAHEILDALPVDRIILREGILCQQGVQLIEYKGKNFLDFVELELSPSVRTFLKELSEHTGLLIPPRYAQEGWSTELHTELSHWFRAASKVLRKGILLVIDYALPAKSYYNSNRHSGTILTYKDQKTSDKILFEPGQSDITSHLCVDSLILEAEKNGWTKIGSVKQGQALLALGLSERISRLRNFERKDLSLALMKRESLLRLVDPTGLGGFNWFAFQIDKKSEDVVLEVNSMFLNEPM